MAVRYNIYRDEVSQIGLWTKEGDSKFQLDKLFDDFPMDVRIYYNFGNNKLAFCVFWQDFLFTMTGNPYDVYLDADVKTEIEDPRRAYDNHTAYEIEVLRQICMVGRRREDMLSKHAVQCRISNINCFSAKKGKLKRVTLKHSGGPASFFHKKQTPRSWNGQSCRCRRFCWGCR